MNDNTFKYLRPTTSARACELKDQYGESARFWAGGTDLLLQWRQNVVSLDYCIDLSFIPDLDYIRKDSDSVSIGALTRVASVEASSELNHSFSIIREAAGELATPQIRNTATIGGNICRAAPSADMAPPLLVLGAQMKLINASGERWIPLDAFFLDLNHTALEKNELLSEIRVPNPTAETASCFLKIGRTVIDIAIVNMAARMTMDDKGILTDVRIAFGAVAPTPLRITAAEKMLMGADVSKIRKNLVDEVSNKAANEIKPITDVRGTVEYRREMTRVLMKRAVDNIIQTLQRRLNP